MTNLDWPLRKDISPDRVQNRTIPSAFSAQGIRDALRNAYSDVGEQIPADLSALLEKLG